MAGHGRPNARQNNRVDMWTRAIFKTFHGTVEHGGQHGRTWQAHARTNSHVDMWTRTIFKTLMGFIEIMDFGAPGRLSVF